MLSALCWALLWPLALAEVSSPPGAVHLELGPLVPRGQGMAAPRHGHAHAHAHAHAKMHSQRRNMNASVADVVLYGRNDMEPDDRNPDGSAYGPLSFVPGCFFCPTEEDRALKGHDLLDSLTVEKMKTYMRKKITDRLHNQCVFYTSSLTKPNPQYLSKGAAEWACSKGKMSIWHLWPNKLMAASKPVYNDFYGINEEDNWLYSIKLLGNIGSKPAVIGYFENMSRAIAESCTGEVVVMTQAPRDMAQFSDGRQGENIWKNKEKPALEQLKIEEKITKFYVVDYNDMTKIYEYDIHADELVTGVALPQSVLQSRATLEHREACSSSGLDALAGMPGDPFSDPYSLF